MTDTAQRRAEAWMIQYGCYGGTMLADLVSLLQQARRAALEEASKLAREHSKRAAVAKYNVFKGEKFEFRAECIGNEIADALDRLREGVGK